MEEFLKDLYKAECKKNQTYIIVNSILIAVLSIVFMICIFLAYQLSTYEQVTITETTETYDNDVDRDNANIVNGNQYNDSATHNDGVDE